MQVQQGLREWLSLMIRAYPCFWRVLWLTSAFNNQRKLIFFRNKYKSLSLYLPQNLKKVDLFFFNKKRFHFLITAWSSLSLHFSFHLYVFFSICLSVCIIVSLSVFLSVLSSHSLSVWCCLFVCIILCCLLVRFLFFCLLY